MTNPGRKNAMGPGGEHQAISLWSWREDKDSIVFLLRGHCVSRSHGKGEAGPGLTGNRLYQSLSWPPFCSHSPGKGASREKGSERILFSDLGHDTPSKKVNSDFFLKGTQ